VLRSFKESKYKKIVLIKNKQIFFAIPLGNPSISHFFSVLPSTLKYLYSMKPVGMHIPAKQLSANDSECSENGRTDYRGCPTPLGFI
jgi:hypothetical protein